MTFAGNPNAVAAAHLAVKLCLGKRVPFPAGHSLTPTRADVIRVTDATAFLFLEVDVEGFPWALLVAALGVIGGGLFAFLCLTKVERILDKSPLTAAIIAAAFAGLVGLGAALFLRKGKA